LNGSHIKCLARFADLGSLSLGGNNIKDYDELQPLTELKGLLQLDLFGCAVSEKKDYREKLFAMFPSLQV